VEVKVFSTVEMDGSEMSLDYSWFYKVTFRDIDSIGVYFYWMTIEETIFYAIINNNIKIDLNQEDKDVIENMVKIGLKNQDVFKEKIKEKFDNNIKLWLKGKKEDLVQEINKIKKVDKN